MAALLMLPADIITFWCRNNCRSQITKQLEESGFPVKVPHQAWFLIPCVACENIQMVVTTVNCQHSRMFPNAEIKHWPWLRSRCNMVTLPSIHLYTCICGLK